MEVTLICDNMSASVMSKGWVQAVFVGCDRVAANGDTANKIGKMCIRDRSYAVLDLLVGSSSLIRDHVIFQGTDIGIQLFRRQVMGIFCCSDQCIDVYKRQSDS